MFKIVYNDGQPLPVVILLMPDNRRPVYHNGTLPVKKYGSSCLGPRFYWAEWSGPSCLWAELSVIH